MKIVYIAPDAGPRPLMSAMAVKKLLKSHDE
jgi:hypothetical protein